MLHVIAFKTDKATRPRSMKNSLPVHRQHTCKSQKWLATKLFIFANTPRTQFMN